MRTRAVTAPPPPLLACSGAFVLPLKPVRCPR